MDLVTLKHSFSDSGIKLSQAAVNFWSNHSVTDNLKKIFWFCLDSDESSLNPDELLVSDSVKFAWQILYCNWYASVPEKKISATLNISGFWATPSPFIFNYASAHMLPIWHVISFLFKNCGSPKWTASNSRNIDIFKFFVLSKAALVLTPLETTSHPVLETSVWVLIWRQVELMIYLKAQWFCLSTNLAHPKLRDLMLLCSGKNF